MRILCGINSAQSSNKKNAIPSARPHIKDGRALLLNPLRPHRVRPRDSWPHRANRAESSSKHRSEESEPTCRQDSFRCLPPLRQSRLVPRRRPYGHPQKVPRHRNGNRGKPAPRHRPHSLRHPPPDAAEYTRKTAASRPGKAHVSPT